MDVLNLFKTLLNQSSKTHVMHLILSLLLDIVVNKLRIDRFFDSHSLLIIDFPTLLDKVFGFTVKFKRFYQAIQ